MSQRTSPSFPQHAAYKILRSYRTRRYPLATRSSSRPSTRGWVFPNSRLINKRRTAKIQNVGFKIQGGPAIRQRTPARTPQNRRPQSEDLPQGCKDCGIWTKRLIVAIKRRTSGRISMPPPGPFPPAPPPRSSAKVLCT